MNDYKEHETTLRDYMRVLFKHRSVIYLTILVVGVTTAVGLKLKTKMYESRVKLLITAEKQVEAPYYREIYGSRNVQQTLTQAEIVKSNPVLVRVVRTMGLNTRSLDDEKQFASAFRGRVIDFQKQFLMNRLKNLTPKQKDAYFYRRSIENLKDNIRVEPIRDTNMFFIIVRDYNPLAAAVIANVVSRSYVIFDLEQQLAELLLKYGDKHPTVLHIKNNIAELAETLNGDPLEDVKAIGPASVKIVEQASIPLEPVGVPKTLTFGLAILMSIFLGIMLAFIFEYSDQSLKSPQEVERILGLPCLGSIPKKKMLEKTIIDSAKAKSTYGRFYQILADQFYMLFKDRGVRTFLLTSAEAHEGTEHITVNLGHGLSERLQLKVLAVDANLRRPSFQKIYKIETTQGLSDVLEAKAPLEKCVQVISEKLHVLPAGKTELNPLILFDSDIMQKTLKLAREKYDLVLLNCPNLKNYKDATILSSFIDGVVFVTNEERTRRLVAKAALSALEAKQAKILGVVLNNRTFPIPKFVYDRM